MSEAPRRSAISFRPGRASSGRQSATPMCAATAESALLKSNRRSLNSRAARRAKALRVELASPDSHLALEKSCREAGRPELAYELEQIIERVINRKPTARHTLVYTAKTLLSGLPDPRGRRFNIKTAKHQLLLHLLEAKKMPRAYTWNDREGECVDPAAKATRIAVGDPSFDPRYAYRDLRKRKLH